jgi:hypothetical protein
VLFQNIVEYHLTLQKITVLTLSNLYELDRSGKPGWLIIMSSICKVLTNMTHSYPRTVCTPVTRFHQKSKTEPLNCAHLAALAPIVGSKMLGNFLAMTTSSFIVIDPDEDAVACFIIVSALRATEAKLII